MDLDDRGGESNHLLSLYRGPQKLRLLLPCISYGSKGHDFCGQLYMLRSERTPKSLSYFPFEGQITSYCRGITDIVMCHWYTHVQVPWRLFSSCYTGLRPLRSHVLMNINKISDCQNLRMLRFIADIRCSGQDSGDLLTFKWVYWVFTNLKIEILQDENSNVTWSHFGTHLTWTKFFS